MGQGMTADSCLLLLLHMASLTKVALTDCLITVDVQKLVA